MNYIHAKIVTFLILILSVLLTAKSEETYVINDQEYFEQPGLNVMVFQDFYPDGHQGGVTIVQNGVRVVANGDLRLEPAPGQWQPVPKMGKREVDRDNNEIRANLWYPDSSKNRKGFNPILYPDLAFKYTVRVKPEGHSFRVSVDLEKPLPEEWYGKVGFNLELFPGFYFSKTYYMDEEFGIFPRQVNGPVYYDQENKLQTESLARGKKLIVVPENPNEKITFQAVNSDIELIDGRGEHNNGWFIVRTRVKKGTLLNAVEMIITPGFTKEWKYDPVIHVSQVGYHPDQKKTAVVELDKREKIVSEMTLCRISENGGIEEVKTSKPEQWGAFLRYNYLQFDFSEVKNSGLYRLKYGNKLFVPFQINKTVYDRHVWQPTLEYFLPVQMCHMRVNDRYKVWHGLCHDDDALMAPTNLNHFDGYMQGPSTLTTYKPYENVPGLNVGGWHDAGDYDLRVESQAKTVQILGWIRELFGADYDVTTIDQNNKLVEMHRPDGKQDILQQIEHGALSIVAGYKALGRLYRGIICSDLRQYTLLGDGSVMTNNIVYDASNFSDNSNMTCKMDDRWVFTEENPSRELLVAACLATGSRALKEYNDQLANECLEIAKKLWEIHSKRENTGLVDTSVELFLATNDKKYSEFLVKRQEQIINNINRTALSVSRIVNIIRNEEFSHAFSAALEKYALQIEEMVKETPFGVKYTPDIWGAGWGIQEFGVKMYFLHRAFPDIFSAEPMFNALNFILGSHPGMNSSSFVSGVGAESIIVAYGVNRDDWSYIPGGSVSGTALIRPDFPELKIWPYFWQQSEYVMGGGATNFMFLVLAAQDLLN